MTRIAILGAGELGGLLAHVLARRHIAQSIQLVDDAGRVAEGKALDLMQAAPIEGFATEISGSTDVSRAAGAAIVVLADRHGGAEWQDDAALMLLERLRQFEKRAVTVFAGGAQRGVLERAVRELHVPREQLLGSSPEALAAAARAMVALEADASPRDVALSVLGVPPAHTVIPWEDATVGGVAISRVLDGPARRRIETRIAGLWPPGPYALASAAAAVIASLTGRSRRRLSCFVGPDDGAGVRARAASLPVRLGPAGIVRIDVPALSVREQVLLDNAMLL
jgi:malate dehydrogenase